MFTPSANFKANVLRFYLTHLELKVQETRESNSNRSLDLFFVFPLLFLIIFPVWNFTLHLQSLSVIVSMSVINVMMLMEATPTAGELQRTVHFHFGFYLS